MNRDRWKDVNEIFHAALELPASERREFIHTASNGDLDLQSDVDRLIEADKQAGSYLESPLLPTELFQDFESSPPPFQPGDMLKNRFRILRLVGEGGMGHVFEAYDTELKVRVALKAIRSEIAGNPTALDFFRREVRTARTITHPNVCRTFDLDRGFLNEATGSSREFFFLTMEFLEGETLGARLKRTGRLATEEALGIARQIAAALDAAHSVGIVHRDIKPANIMLVDSPQSQDQQPRAVITDFGLARQDPLHSSAVASSISHAGAIGTLAYMAPEQLESGNQASAATDIYAFGLVLYEMVTGIRAFPSANLLSGIAQRLAGPPPSPRTMSPDLPEIWEYAIQGCLRVTLGERFRSTGQVLEALGGAPITLPPISSFRVLPPSPTRSPWPLGRRFQLAAAILLVVVALSVVGFRLYRSRADSKVAPGALVYLTAVKNETGERLLDNLTELLQESLGQSAQINLLDQSRVGDTLQLMTKSPDTVIDPPTAREIALRTGTVRVIFATVSGSNGSYSLNLDIQQPDGGGPSRIRNHWRQSFSWKSPGSTNSSNAIPPDLLAAIRNSSDWIRNKAGESANDIARLDAPPEDVTTGNWEALTIYSNAEDLYRHGKKEEAVSALQNAVQIDPQFALAYARLGDITVSLGRTEEGYRAYGHALNTDFDRRLTRRELDRIRGIYASDSWDYQAAESAFHDYTVYYENDYAGWFFRALPLMRLGRFQEAITTLKRAYAIDPSRPSAPYDLATCYIELGDLASVRQWIEVIKQQHQPELVAQLEGILDFLNGHNGDAEKNFLSMSSSASPLYRLRAFSYLTRLKAEQGDYPHALAWTETGVAEASADGNQAQRAAFLMDRAYLNCLSDDFSACLDDSRQSLSLDNSPELLISASQLFGQGIQKTSGANRVEFLNELGALSRISPHEIENAAWALATFRIHMETLLAHGNWHAALNEARRMSTIDTQFSRREFLARVLLIAAQHTPSGAGRRALMTEARDAYGKTALNPPAVWVQPSLYLPGTLAEDIEDYLYVSHETQVNGEEQHKAVDFLARLRSAPSAQSR